MIDRDKVLKEMQKRLEDRTWGGMRHDEYTRAAVDVMFEVAAEAMVPPRFVQLPDGLTEEEFKKAINSEPGTITVVNK